MLRIFTSENTSVYCTDLNIPYSVLSDVYFSVYGVIYEQLLAYFIFAIKISRAGEKDILTQKLFLSTCKNQSYFDFFLF